MEKEGSGKESNAQWKSEPKNFFCKHILVVDIFHLPISYVSEAKSRYIDLFVLDVILNLISPKLHFVYEIEMKSNNSESTNNLSA